MANYLPSGTTTQDGIEIISDGNGHFTLSGTATSNANLNLTDISWIVRGHRYLKYESINTIGNYITQTFYGRFPSYFSSSAKVVVPATGGGNEKFGFTLTNGTQYSGEIQFYLLDLTEMFGSGNEPSTVAEFESWLSQHVLSREYLPYF